MPHSPNLLFYLCASVLVCVRLCFYFYIMFIIHIFIVLAILFKYLSLLYSAHNIYETSRNLYENNICCNLLILQTKMSHVAHNRLKPTRRAIGNSQEHDSSPSNENSAPFFITNGVQEPDSFLSNHIAASQTVTKRISQTDYIKLIYLIKICRGTIQSFLRPIRILSKIARQIRILCYAPCPKVRV